MRDPNWNPYKLQTTNYMKQKILYNITKNNFIFASQEQNPDFCESV